MICYKNRLKDDSIDFALRISDLCENIVGSHVYVNQVLLSSSSIGANVSVTRYNQNKDEIISKYNLALEDCLTTEYWIDLLYKKGQIEKEEYKELCGRSVSIKRRLITFISSMEKTMQMQKLKR